MPSLYVDMPRVGGTAAVSLDFLVCLLPLGLHASQSPHFAWGLQAQRLWRQQTALDLLLGSPLLQQQARVQPVLPLLQQRSWRAAVPRSFGQLAVLLPPLGILTDILRVIEVSVSCCCDVSFCRCCGLCSCTLSWWR